jgi:hypothetical protein
MFKTRAHDYQFIFLKSLFARPSVFKHKNTLAEHGLKDVLIMSINPLRSPEISKHQLKSHIKKMFFMKSRPVIIFVQSQSCEDLIYSCLKENLSLFKKAVHKIICVDSARSSLAQLALADLTPGDYQQYLSGHFCLTRGRRLASEDRMIELINWSLASYSTQHSDLPLVKDEEFYFP